MNRRIITLGLAVGLVVNFSPIYKLGNNVVLAETIDNKEVKIEDKKLHEPSRGKVNAVIPQVRGLRNKNFEDLLNKKLERELARDLKFFVRESKKEDSYFNMDYDIEYKGDIISIIVNKTIDYKTSQPIIESKDFINICIENGDILNIDEIFKEELDYKNLLNKLILKELDKYPNLKDVYQGINDGQDFYLNKHGELVIVFKPEELKEDYKKYFELRLDIDDLKNIVIEEAINGPVILEREIEKNSNHDVKIIVPELKGIKDKNIIRDVNENILRLVETSYENFLEDSKETAGKSELKINYDIKYKGDILSLELIRYQFIAGNKKGESFKEFYNIDLKDSRLLSLEDIFKDSVNYEDFLNKRLSEADSNLKLEKDNSFYINSAGDLMLVFNGQSKGENTNPTEYKISSKRLKDQLEPFIAKLGVNKKDKIYINNKEISLTKEIYLSDKDNIMLPLIDLVKELGYVVNWDDSTKVIELSKDNIEIKISLNDNKYYYNKALILLEDEAKSVDGVSFVPRDFIDKVLKGDTSSEDGYLHVWY